MKLRHLVILVMALLLVSTLVGLAVLRYVTMQRMPSGVAETGGTPGSTDPSNTSGAMNAQIPTALPHLVTATATHTPSPTWTPSPTPSPTPTATPSFTPSPTPEPAVRLANAYRAKRNGDYGEARSQFDAVVQAAESKDEVAEALYEAGVCAYLDGDLQTTQNAMARLISDYPGDRRVPAAHFYLAEADSRAGGHESAVEHYRAYLAHQDILADLVYARIGNCLASLADYEGAIGAYQRALEKTSDLGQQYDLREKIALTYSAWGHYDEAIDWLQGIVDRSENAYRLARIWYLQGQVYRLAENEQQALAAFTQAVEGDPQPGYAHAALVALVDADVQVNEYQRGLINYYAGSYEAAVAAFNRYMAATSDYSSDAHHYVALSYLNSGAFDSAVRECERALSAFPDTIPHWGDLWLTKARALSGLGRIDDSVRAFAAFVDSQPEHPLVPQAQWEAGQLLEQTDRFLEAADIYARLAGEHPNADRAPAARFRAGICRYRDGDASGATAAWRALIAGYPNSSEAIQARYWLGKVMWSRGQAADGRDLLQLLATEHPRNYYGLRAAHLVASNGRTVLWPLSPAQVEVATAGLTGDESEEEEQAVAWLRGWAASAHEMAAADVPSHVAESPQFRRAVEMAAVGLRSEAQNELESLRQAAALDPVQLYSLALAGRDLGLYAVSVRAASDLVSLAPETSVLDMPRLVQRLAFPTYFDDLVSAEAASYDLDALLVFALIRQESVFDDQVSSWAGAVGLAQVMPSTGDWIADMMPYPEFGEDLLKRAYVNVKFGAWFLDRILQQTNGDVMTALAGYNGGPANSVKWMNAANGDPDLFVEIITRPEPQLYVREIYRHYDVYVHLYGQE